MQRVLPLAAWLILFSIGLRAIAADDQPLPRYKLQVGQQFVYRNLQPPHEWDNGKGGKDWSRDLREWTVWVVRQHAVGGWGLVFRQSFQRTSNRGGRESSYGFALDGHFDLTPEGRMTENRTFRAMADPTSLFPPLPPDEASLESSWTATTSVDDARRTFKIADSDAASAGNEWIFDEQVEGALDSIYLSTQRRRYEFDRQEGWIRKVTTTSESRWPGPEPSRSTSTTELVGVTQIEPEKVATFVADSDKFFATSEKCERLIALAGREYGKSIELLNEAQSLLLDTKSQLSVPDVRAMLERNIEDFPNQVKQVLAEWATKGSILGKPSPQWKTVDISGSPRSLADYRGKVVVLDFWYRGCGFCIRAMPQMKQLADDFRGQRVAILGVNSDEKDEDALFVIDKLALNYPTVKNGSDSERISAKYKVSLWPTLVIIDGKGVVRHYHAGQTPTLHDDVAAVIRQLLAEDQP